jgi:protein MpaA
MVTHSASSEDFDLLSPAWSTVGRRVVRTHPWLEEQPVPRIACPRVPGEQETLKVGIFGGIHGDEPSGTSACHVLAAWAHTQPAALTGYNVHLYPECNPSGLAAGTRHSRAGLDLNREFWRGSDQPEVRWLEGCLRSERYDVIISLHEDDTSDGLYGFVGGALLSEHLLEPALEAASEYLPRNLRPAIDGFAANRGIIREGYRGVLSAPPEQRPRALEIVFETPGQAPHEMRTQAAVIAVRTILAEYRKLLAHGANL